MKQRKNYLKVTTDLTYVLGEWTIGYFIVLTIIQVIKYITLPNDANGLGNFFNIMYGSAPIYMLVIGIIAAFVFLPMYVNHGVTRKEYFVGGVLSTFILSLLIIAISLVLTGLEHWIVQLANLDVSFVSDADDNGMNVIGNFVLSIVQSSFSDLSNIPLGISIIVFCIRVFFFFTIGWFIGITFYRFGVLHGLGSIALSILAVSFFDLFWEAKEGNLLTQYLSIEFGSLPAYASIICSIVIIIFLLWLIRAITKKAPIKL